MISQILKFALEVIVVAFIAHYVAQKMEKAIDTKDACYWHWCCLRYYCHRKMF